MGNEDQTASNIIPCSVCREPIQDGARKCVHCDSFLDWRRWLGLSQTTLALLVAFVSVVAASAPRLGQLLTPRYSDLKISIRQVFSQRLELAVSNHGNQAGQLLSARLLATTKNRKTVDSVELEIVGAPAIAGAQDTLFGLSVPPALIPAFLSWPPYGVESTSTIVRIREFGKEPEERSLNLPLAQFRLLCRATEDLDTISRRAPGQVDARPATRCIEPTSAGPIVAVSDGSKWLGHWTLSYGSSPSHSLRFLPHQESLYGTLWLVQPLGASQVTFSKERMAADRLTARQTGTAVVVAADWLRLEWNAAFIVGENGPYSLTGFTDIRLDNAGHLRGRDYGAGLPAQEWTARKSGEGNVSSR